MPPGLMPADNDSQVRRSWMDLLPVVVPCLIGAAMVGIAIFGFWVAAAVARPSGNPLTASPERLLAPVKFILSWLVMFGPFFFFGTAMLRSAIRKNWPDRRAWRLFAALAAPRWLTPAGGSGYAAQLQRYEMDGPLPSTKPAAQLLDDDAAWKANRAGYIAAKIIGMFVGCGLTAGGIIGLVVAIADVHRAAYWDAVSWRLATLPLLVGCVLALFFGILVLRDTFAPEPTAWLAPLRTFGVLVWLRTLAQSQSSREPKRRDLSGSGPTKLLR